MDLKFHLSMGGKQDEVPKRERGARSSSDVPAGGIMAKTTFQTRVRKCMM